MRDPSLASWTRIMKHNAAGHREAGFMADPVQPLVGSFIKGHTKRSFRGLTSMTVSDPIVSLYSKLISN